MKKSSWYLILTIMDIILIILWPIVAITTPYPAWLAFCAGAVWCSDLYDVFRHWANYKQCKAMED